MTTATFTIEEATKVYNAFKALWNLTPSWTSFTVGQTDAFFTAELVLLKANLIESATYNVD
jgi:hypothetical protein